MSGLYIHIPFCKKACNYCNFHFTVSTKNKIELIKAIIKELEYKKNYLGHDKLETIYFGGGTPSLLSYKQINELSMNLDIVLYFNTPEDVTIKRLTGRRVCPKCGFNYHVDNIPPKVLGVCDTCEVALIQRDDDKKDTIMNRLKIYSEQTSPLLDFYKEKGLLREVRGDHDVNQLFGELKELFNNEGLI
jgi:adenylate kinase